MNLDAAVRAATGRGVRSAVRVGGGDINEAYRAELEDGTPAFVKTRADARPGEYAAEAEGLRWLGEPGALRVPEVLGAGDDVLVLAWVEAGRAGDAATLGAGLAAVHAAGAPAFGGSQPMRIGALELPNTLGGGASGGGASAGGASAGGASGGGASAGGASAGGASAGGASGGDWATFYAECRLRPLIARAGLSAAGVRAVERVCERMRELAGPEEPPARLHGDLWSGNVLWDRSRQPWLIDPAAHGGHREVDLAMLRLFGSPGPEFLSAYAARHPLAPGHAERVALYQLFPLLVHAALFGGGYAASAERAARRYTD